LREPRKVGVALGCLDVEREVRSFGVAVLLQTGLEGFKVLVFRGSGEETETVLPWVSAV
jgi:hypothetical protein